MGPRLGRGFSHLPQQLALEKERNHICTTLVSAYELRGIPAGRGMGGLPHLGGELFLPAGTGGGEGWDGMCLSGAYLQEEGWVSCLIWEGSFSYLSVCSAIALRAICWKSGSLCHMMGVLLATYVIAM